MGNFDDLDASQEDCELKWVVTCELSFAVSELLDIVLQVVASSSAGQAVDEGSKWPPKGET